MKFRSFSRDVTTRPIGPVSLWPERQSNAKVGYRNESGEPVGRGDVLFFDYRDVVSSTIITRLGPSGDPSIPH